jgi:putative hemolysin
MPATYLSDVIVLSFCVIFSAFYSASEAALVSLGIDRTKQLIKEGGPKGKALQFLATHSNALLSTILLGNNLVNIFIASYAAQVAQKIFVNDALAISVGVSTFVILIFGEIMPKTFARNRGEGLIIPSIRILQVNYYIFFPVVYCVNKVIKLVLGKNAELNSRFVTIDDIEFMVNKAEQEKSMDSKHLDLLSSVLEFPTIKVKDIMVPRGQVSFIKLGQPVQDIAALIKESGHSRYPVVNGTLDETLGFLHVKDLLFYGPEDKYNNLQYFFKESSLGNIQEHLRRPLYVYEHMKIQSVFDHMNKRKVHLAMVKDENGIIVGIISFEDILEEIFGEIQDEHDTDEEEVKVKFHEGVVVPGSILLRDLSNQYDIKIPQNDNYSTLNGFLLDHLGNIFPRKGMVVIWENCSFFILRVEQSEIKKVKIRDVGGENHLFTKNLPNPNEDKNYLYESESRETVEASELEESEEKKMELTNKKNTK